jgi:hypothetical protein
MAGEILDGRLPEGNCKWKSGKEHLFKILLGDSGRSTACNRKVRKGNPQRSQRRPGEQEWSLSRAYLSG